MNILYDNGNPASVVDGGFISSSVPARVSDSVRQEGSVMFAPVYLVTSENSNVPTVADVGGRTLIRNSSPSSRSHSERPTATARPSTNPGRSRPSIYLRSRLSTKPEAFTTTGYRGFTTISPMEWPASSTSSCRLTGDYSPHCSLCCPSRTTQVSPNPCTSSKSHSPRASNSGCGTKSRAWHRSSHSLIASSNPRHRSPSS